MEASPEGRVPPEERVLQDVSLQMSRLWWLWLIFGFLWIVIALVILQFDQASITTVGVLIGLMFLFSGFQQFALGSFVGGWLQFVMWFFGILLVIAGVIAFISPENTFAAIADILGFLFLLVGIFWIIQAFGERDTNELWWFGLISGVAMIVLAFWTGGQFFIEKAYVLLVFAGIWALFAGVNDIFRAFQLRKIGQDRAVPPAGPPPAEPPPPAVPA
jgi:uncharacterized membrane protein HdeD (DUF308 family)